MGDLLEITIAVRSKVHSAFHPFVVGKMSTSTGDKLCCVCNGIGVAPTPAVSCGRCRKLQENAMKKEPSGCLRPQSLTLTDRLSCWGWPRAAERSLG